jgi:hypothetical protein
MLSDWRHRSLGNRATCANSIARMAMSSQFFEVQLQNARTDAQDFDSPLTVPLMLS